MVEHLSLIHIFMDRLEEIRRQISKCDDIIIKQLSKRMNLILDIIQYKKEKEMPVLQTEQEHLQFSNMEQLLQSDSLKDEILDIYSYIIKTSRKYQARNIFDYNIMLIGFMGTGKSTIARELSHLLEIEDVEIDELIVKKAGKSIPDIFEDEYKRQV